MTPRGLTTAVTARRPRGVDRARHVPLLWAAGIAVAAVAVALRLLYVGVVPRFTDETDVVIRALEITRGRLLPLTDTDGYIGAGFSYLLAGALALFGPNPVLPRYVVVVSGTVTVGAVFLLGRELAQAAPTADQGRRTEDEGGRLDPRSASVVGLLAALFVAVSPVHVLVNSRIAWSHATTPLLTTLGLWLLVRAARKAHGPSLTLAGLLFGVALQSHPTALALLPGVLAWTFWRARPLLGRWAMPTIALGAVGCSSLLLHNLLTGFDSVREGLAKSDAYAAERAGPAGYPAALGLELAGLARVLAGAVGEDRGDLVPLSRPDIVAWAVLAPLAVGLAARRGIALPAWVAPPFLLILPLFNGKYEPLLNGRYLMPLVPLIAVAAAALAVSAWRRASASGWRAAPPAVLAATALLLALPPFWLARYERAALGEGGNLPYAELAERIARERRPDETVLLDGELGGARIASGRQGVGVVEYLLRVRPNPLPTASGGVSELAAWIEAGPDAKLLVLLPDARQRFGARHRLTLVGQAPSGREQRLRNAGLYRVEGSRVSGQSNNDLLAPDP